MATRVDIHLLEGVTLEEYRLFKGPWHSDSEANWRNILYEAFCLTPSVRVGYDDEQPDLTQAIRDIFQYELCTITEDIVNAVAAAYRIHSGTTNQNVIDFLNENSGKTAFVISW